MSREDVDIVREIAKNDMELAAAYAVVTFGLSVGEAVFLVLTACR